MAASVANWLAIAVGGVGGTLAAIAGSAAPPPTRAAMPLPPSGEISAQVHAATPAAASAALSESVAPLASSATLTSSAPVRSDSAPSASAAEPTPTPTASAAPSSAPEPASSADTAPLPTTHEKLLRTEMHCDQGKAESCIVAARSYEAGSAGVTDPAKAAKYRRIALTMWISHCDHNSAAACVTLSKLYRAGVGVPQSDRNADALIGRARELCRFTVVPVCNELPSP
jgi:TPR repeat protein